MHPCLGHWRRPLVLRPERERRPCKGIIPAMQISGSGQPMEEQLQAPGWCMSPHQSWGFPQCPSGPRPGWPHPGWLWLIISEGVARQACLAFIPKGCLGGDPGCLGEMLPTPLHPHHPVNLASPSNRPEARCSQTSALK